MSYILDALRRAEAQRSRGAVPTLHAPALDTGPVYPVGTRSPSGIYRLVLMGVGALLLIGLAAWAWWSGSARVEVPPAPVVAGTAGVQTGLTVVAPVPAPPIAPAVQAAPTQPVAAMASASASADVQALSSAALAARPPVPAAVPPAELSPSVSALRAPSRPAVPQRPVAPAREPAPPAVAQSAESPILQRRDLPADLQRGLPALAVSGTVYSTDRAQRILMVNGELLHEGDHIGPELVLEEIRRKDAVLRYRGQRFSVSP